MISNDRAKYSSSSEWLSALRQDEAWLLQEERLLSSGSSDMDALRKKAVERMGDDTVSDYWEIYNHNVEKSIQEAWDTGMSLVKLKIQAIGLLTLEWLERHAETAEAPCQLENKVEPNYFAPTKHLQELLKGAWFKEVRKRDEYDEQWTNEFVDALMESEWKDTIAKAWAVKGERKKITQIKGYIIGLLKDAGVLKGSYNSIAEKNGIIEESRTFSKYMSDGKKQPYTDWVKDYVSGKKNQ